MTGFLIAAAILLFFALILWLPVLVDFRFEKAFFLKIKIGAVPLFSLDGDKPGKPEKKLHREKTKKEKKPKEEAKTEPNFIKQLFEKKEFSEAVRLLLGFANRVFHKLKWLLRRFRAERIGLRIRVASDNAADTAVRYGAVCAAAYPVLAFLDSVSDIRLKQIDITADFNTDQPEFAASGRIRTRIVYLLIFAAGALIEFLKFRKQVEKNE